MSSDPAMADGLNWYSYVNNNPIMYNDPTGLCKGATHTGGCGHQRGTNNGGTQEDTNQGGGGNNDNGGSGSDTTSPSDNGESQGSSEGNSSGSSGGSSSGGGAWRSRKSKSFDFFGEEGIKVIVEDSEAPPSPYTLNPGEGYTHFGYGGDPSLKTQVEFEKGSRMYDTGCLFMSILAIVQIATGYMFSIEEIERYFNVTGVGWNEKDETLTLVLANAAFAYVGKQVGFEQFAGYSLFEYNSTNRLTSLDTSGDFLFQIAGSNGGLYAQHWELFDGEGNRIYRSSNLDVTGETGTSFGGKLHGLNIVRRYEIRNAAGERVM